MGIRFTLDDIRSAGRRGDLEAPPGQYDEEARDRHLTQSFIRKHVYRADQLTNDELHRLTTRWYRQLADGDSIEIEDGAELPLDVPDLSLYAGSTDLERAKSYIRSDPRNANLDDAAVAAQAQVLLVKIRAALDNASAPIDEVTDDPSVSPEAQALRNLERRDPEFRALSHDDRFKAGPNRERFRLEAKRIRERRLAAEEREQEEERRLLADASSVSPPEAPVLPMPDRELPSLAQLRTYPPARGVASDLARVVTFMTQRQPTYAFNTWEDQLRMAKPVLQAILAREPNAVAGSESREPARNFRSNLRPLGQV